MTETQMQPFPKEKETLLLEALEALSLTHEPVCAPAMVQLAKSYGFTAYPYTCTIPEGHPSLPTGVGVVVTYEETKFNDGIYLFFLNKDKSTSLVVLCPSNVSRGHLITNHLTRMENAISGLDLEPTTIFDQTELAGLLIERLVLKPLMKSLAIPKELEENFTTLYLPRFMANATRLILGEEGLEEDAIYQEPYQAKELLLHPERYQKVEPKETPKEE